MSLRDFFKKKEDKTPDPISGLTLANMKSGYFVDYDMETWRVVSLGKYNWGSGDITWEWQLESHDDTIFLERESDDIDYWTVSKKLSFQKLDPGIKKRFIESDDPPETIVFDKQKYYLSETGGALYYKDNANSGREMFKWDYADDTEQFWLTIEQWGERDYELSQGKKVEEYQFSNILPSADKL